MQVGGGERVVYPLFIVFFVFLSRLMAEDTAAAGRRHPPAETEATVAVVPDVVAAITRADDDILDACPSLSCACAKECSGIQRSKRAPCSL